MDDDDQQHRQPTRTRTNSGGGDGSCDVDRPDMQLRPGESPEQQFDEFFERRKAQRTRWQRLKAKMNPHGGHSLEETIYKTYKQLGGHHYIAEFEPDGLEQQFANIRIRVRNSDVAIAQRTAERSRTQPTVEREEELPPLIAVVGEEFLVNFPQDMEEWKEIHDKAENEQADRDAEQATARAEDDAARDKSKAEDEEHRENCRWNERMASESYCLRSIEKSERKADDRRMASARVEQRRSGDRQRGQQQERSWRAPQRSAARRVHFALGSPTVHHIGRGETRRQLAANAAEARRSASLPPQTNANGAPIFRQARPSVPRQPWGTPARTLGDLRATVSRYYK